MLDVLKIQRNMCKALIGSPLAGFILKKFCVNFLHRNFKLKFKYNFKSDPQIWETSNLQINVWFDIWYATFESAHLNAEYSYAILLVWKSWFVCIGSWYGCWMGVLWISHSGEPRSNVECHVSARPTVNSKLCVECAYMRKETKNCNTTLETVNAVILVN